MNEPKGLDQWPQYMQTWDIYMQAWGETDAEKQSELLKQVLTLDSLYTDPVTEASLKGYEKIQTYIQLTQEMIPGLQLKRTSFSRHHDYSLAKWDMLNGEGKWLSSGLSFGKFDENFKILETVAFYTDHNLAQS